MFCLQNLCKRNKKKLCILSCKKSKVKKRTNLKYLPAPEPATPTVAAPAPMNLAAVSISRFWTETESGLKNKHRNYRHENKKFQFLKSREKTYRTAVRVATRGAARTTRFISDQFLKFQKLNHHYYFVSWRSLSLSKKNPELCSFEQLSCWLNWT